MKKDFSYTFAKLNPVTLAVYFLGVSSVLVCTSHPFYTLGAFISAVLFRLYIKFDIKSVVSGFLWILALTIVNPLFSHHGNTPILFINDKPYTSEALIYGLRLSLALTAAFLLCITASGCFTSDKISFLVSGAFPKIALILSMTLRYITIFKSEYRKISDAKKTLGRAQTEDFFGRLKNSASCFSTLFSNAIEFSAYTADSMLSRGFMLKKRTYYSDFRFSIKDFFVVFITLFSVIITFYLDLNKKAEFYYYPVVSELELNSCIITSSVLYFGVSMLPFLFEAAENIKWKLLESKI
ncbi:MAG: energy-coupling factor transporter transmembrane protein EcfT [Clostridia bacterium]|nr:energy-coupling factor transporter transmembrane protein EcfT [Clostridia bacterium]